MCLMWVLLIQAVYSIHVKEQIQTRLYKQNGVVNLSDTDYDMSTDSIK